MVSYAITLAKADGKASELFNKKVSTKLRGQCSYDAQGSVGYSNVSLV